MSPSSRQTCIGSRDAFSSLWMACGWNESLLLCSALRLNSCRTTHYVIVCPVSPMQKAMQSGARG